MGRLRQLLKLSFLDHLRLHFVLPLFYKLIVSKGQEDNLPHSVHDRLQKAFMTSRVHYMRAEKQLNDIISVFNKENIKVLVTRGPALANLAYPDPVLRSYRDLDLLVLPDQASGARKVLKDMGYFCVLL